MTLFGQTFDGQQLFGLVSLISVLALWLIVLGRERHYARWFRQWEADRKARRDAELTQQGHAPVRGRKAGHKTGPWG